jgi:hypothetical protein
MTPCPAALLSAVDRYVPVIDGRVEYIVLPPTVISIVITFAPPGAVFTLNTGYFAVEMRKAKGARIFIVLDVDIAFVVTENTVVSSLRAPPIMIGFATPASDSNVPAVPTPTKDPDSVRVFVAPFPIVITEFALDPDIVLVITLVAAKLPPESLATIELIVFALVAFTVHVTALDPLNAVPLR